MDDNTESVAAFTCCGILCCKKQKIVKTKLDDNEAAPDKNNPVFSGNLPNPLLPGHAIEIVGAPLEHCTRFSVNFTCGKSPESDVAFHFNPRLEQNYVVRNTRVSGRWGPEETVSCIRLDMPRQVQFRLSFFIAQKQFMVSINGTHFCSYDFRAPIAKTKYLEIHGDVTVDSVDVKQMQQYPEDTIMEHVTVIPAEDTFQSGTLLPNPFIGHLPNGFKIGWQLEIIGKVKLLPHSFYINFQEGKQYWPHPIIPLHLNPRFNTMVHSHCLVRNAWINGSWGSEERTTVFNFVPGRLFHLVVQMESDHYTVWVDGKMEGEFKFRTTQCSIDTVYIQGDVYVYKVFTQNCFSNMLLDNTIN